MFFIVIHLQGCKPESQHRQSSQSHVNLQKWTSIEYMPGCWKWWLWLDWMCQITVVGMQENWTAIMGFFYVCISFYNPQTLTEISSNCFPLDRFLGTAIWILYQKLRYCVVFFCYFCWGYKTYLWVEKAWDGRKILTQVVHSWISCPGRFLSSLWRTSWNWNQWNTAREHGQIHSLQTHLRSRGYFILINFSRADISGTTSPGALRENEEQHLYTSAHFGLWIHSWWWRPIEDCFWGKKKKKENNH